MFDIDSGKLLIVAVLALIVIGPKELPRVLRQVGQSVGKLRRMAGEFQGQFMDAMKEADVADIRKELDELNKSAALDVHFDPARDIKRELDSAMEAPAVTADAAVASPAVGFELPSTEIAELNVFQEGIAPAAEPVVIDAAPTVPILPPDQSLPSHPGLNGAGSDVFPVATKRKILLKRRTSRLNIVQPDEIANRTGEPLIVRRRTVRAKASLGESVSTS